MLGLNTFDIILGFLLVISTMAGFSKGFTTEALKIVAWAGAIFLTIVALPISTVFMADYISSVFIAKLVGMAVTFLVSFFFLNFLAKFVGERIRSSFIAPIDRGLGAAFGFTRGVLILSAAYLLYSNLVAEEDQSNWVMEARSQPYLAIGADTLEAITPDLFERAGEISDEVLDADTEALLQEMKSNMPDAAGVKDTVVDYTLEQRDELEDLIEEVANEEDQEG